MPICLSACCRSNELAAASSTAKLDVCRERGADAVVNYNTENLKERIKQQEGATQRVQEMLNALETRLGMSDTGYPALVFYQLRRLWQRVELAVMHARWHEIIARAFWGRPRQNRCFDLQIPLPAQM